MMSLSYIRLRLLLGSLLSSLLLFKLTETNPVLVCLSAFARMSECVITSVVACVVFGTAIFGAVMILCRGFFVVRRAISND